MFLTKIYIILLLYMWSTYSDSIARQSYQISLLNSQLQLRQKQRSIDSIFLKLPTYQDIASIILSADEYALSKFVHTIFLKAQDIDCEALIIYSDEVIGMIKVAIQKRTLTSDKLNILIETAKRQIHRMNRQITRLKQERQSLDLVNLRDLLKTLIVQLQEEYDQYIKVSNQVQDKETLVTGNRQQIKSLQFQADQQRNKIKINKLNIIEYQTEIDQLQKVLHQLKSKKQQAERQVQDSEKKLNELQQKIKQTRDLIDKLQQEIRIKNTKGDSLKKRYIDLQIDVQRLRHTYNVSVSRQSQIISQIQHNKQKILNFKYPLLLQQDNHIKDMIRILNRLLSRFQQQNIQLYYNCYGQGSIQQIVIGKVTLYVIKGARLPSFLYSSYGMFATLSISSHQQINFKLVDIFGASWKTAYGYPFPQKAYNQSDFFIVNDFTCLNPSRIQSSSGQISGISKNIIQVISQNGQKIMLRLGACTRIQSSEYIPIPGQTIYFKGIFRSKSQVNLYSASVF